MAAVAPLTHSTIVYWSGLAKARDTRIFPDLAGLAALIPGEEENKKKKNRPGPGQGPFTPTLPLPGYKVFFLTYHPLFPLFFSFLATLLRNLLTQAGSSKLKVRSVRCSWSLACYPSFLPSFIYPPSGTTAASPLAGSPSIHYIWYVFFTAGLPFSSVFWPTPFPFALRVQYT